MNYNTNFNKNILYLKNKPTAIFKIDNFLDQNLYLSLKKNFPKIDESKLNLNTNNGQHLIDISKFNYDNKEQEEVFYNFEKIIYGEEFFNFLKSKFFFKIATQQNSFKRMLRYLRPAKLDTAKNSSFLDLFSSKVKMGYKCSYMCNKSSLFPHVDAQRKFLSLMLYMPDEDGKDINYGTTFWDFKSSNFTNKHISEQDLLEQFRAEGKVLYKTPFEPNCLYGFIRNDFSWHSVEPLDIHERYIRKSININIFYLN